MEHASAEEFAEIEGVERTGLGTPATRAGVLEKLVKGGFLERKGRQLLPTKKGHNLVVILPESIKSAKLTAEWESALKGVEHGALSPEEFLAGIQKQVSELVACYKNVQVETELFDERESIGACPRCGGSVMVFHLIYYCNSSIRLLQRIRKEILLRMRQQTQQCPVTSPTAPSTSTRSPFHHSP